MLFFDFEVFIKDWLVVILDMDNRKEHVIINSPSDLKQFYQEHKTDIWVGFNNHHYDDYILKGILCDMNPKEINDHIIIKEKAGWTFSNLFRSIPLLSYDVEDGDYLQNIAFVGKTLGGKNIIVIMDNALCTSGLESNGENKKEGVGTYTFACHADLDSDLDTLPYHIYYPKTLA